MIGDAFDKGSHYDASAWQSGVNEAVFLGHEWFMIGTSQRGDGPNRRPQRGNHADF
jgi:hypothetical protein